ncbi:hypothetical protein MY1884_001841 [Beauveria asiatica]
MSQRAERACQQRRVAREIVQTISATELDQNTNGPIYISSTKMVRILPDRSATPERVREYLAQTLTANHGVAPDRATELALRWKYGRGSDLRDATGWDLQRVLDTLLGPPIGHYVFNSVREDEYLEWRQSIAGVLYRCATFGAISALLLSIAYAYKDLSFQTSKRVLAMVSINVLLHWTLAWAAPLHIYNHHDNTLILATVETFCLWAIWLIVATGTGQFL